jgi:hypothetical protein
MPARIPFHRPARFLDGIELELKSEHTSSAYQAIHTIRVTVQRYYMEGRYMSRAEAERSFRKLVEQDETCKSCKIPDILNH